MLNRFKEEINKGSLYSIVSGFFKILSIPGRTLSAAGSTLFGAEKFLQYATRGHGATLTPTFANAYKIGAVSIGVLMTFITRVPALFRSQEPADEIVNDDIEIDDTIDGIEEKEEENSLSCGKQSAIVLFKILCTTSNFLNTVGVVLGSYVGGKALCDFILNFANFQHDDNNKDMEYYITVSVALYLVASNTLSYTTYVIPAANNNTNIMIDAIKQKEKVGIDFKLATTATITAVLNVGTSATFNYLSTEAGIKSIQHDILNFPLFNHTYDGSTDNFSITNWIIILIGSSTVIAGIINEALTTVPQLYRHFDAIKSDCLNVKPATDIIPINATSIAEDQSKQPKYILLFKGVCYSMATLEAINSGIMGFTSIVLTANKLVGFNPYGYVIDIAFPCAISKAICQFSFYGKNGIDQTANDLIKLSKKSNKKVIEESDPINCHKSSNLTTITYRTESLNK